jgi:hypothetical protein
MPAGQSPAGLLAARIHPKHSTAPPLEERWNVCGFNPGKVEEAINCSEKVIGMDPKDSTA